MLEPMVLHSKLKEKPKAIVNGLVPDLEIGDKLMIMIMLGQHVLMIAPVVLCSIITQNLEEGVWTVMYMNFTLKYRMLYQEAI